MQTLQIPPRKAAHHLILVQRVHLLVHMAPLPLVLQGLHVHLQAVEDELPEETDFFQIFFRA